MKRVFAPMEMCALQPKFFGVLYPQAQPSVPLGEDVEVFGIEGPLEARGWGWFDTYEAIIGRFKDTLTLNPKRIILDIDSPGGVVSGCFDAARALRAMAEEAGVELHAFVSGKATSAAYALASAASYVGVSATAELGSIGILATMMDATSQHEMQGIRIQLVTSGARKADGNPSKAIDQDAVAAVQRQVDTLAEEFFGLVLENGWGKSAGAIRSLEGRVVLGREAVALGLASDVTTLQAMMTAADSGALNEEKRMSMKDAISALKKAAESDDEEEAKLAKAALKAMGEGDDEDAEDKSESEEAKASESEEKAENDEKPEEAKAQSSIATRASNPNVLDLAARIHSMEVERQLEKENAQRQELLASRPDFSSELVALLSEESIETVKKMVNTLPKGPKFRGKAADATVSGTRGAEDGLPPRRLDPEAKHALDARMGLTKGKRGVAEDVYSQTFGALISSEDGGA